MELRSLVSRAPPASHFPKPETAGKLAAFCLSSLMDPPFPARSAKPEDSSPTGMDARTRKPPPRRGRVEGAAEQLRAFPHAVDAVSARRGRPVRSAQQAVAIVLHSEQRLRAVAFEDDRRIFCMGVADDVGRSLASNAEQRDVDERRRRFPIVARHVECRCNPAS